MRLTMQYWHFIVGICFFLVRFESTGIERDFGYLASYLFSLLVLRGLRGLEDNGKQVRPGMGFVQ